MAVMTSEVCLAWFRFPELPLAKDILSGPETSVNTPIQKHMLWSCSYKHTSCVSCQLICAPLGRYGVCSRSHPVGAVCPTAQVPQPTAHRRVNSLSVVTCAVSTDVSCGVPDPGSQTGGLLPGLISLISG